ncbi:MAG: peptidyl-prolyl cis-trans isomerase [Phycisphaerae bacterium]|nr:peptidyl-prolyl cis-trans isomerase [Phycisphaerae bacterium]
MNTTLIRLGTLACAIALSAGTWANQPGDGGKKPESPATPAAPTGEPKPEATAKEQYVYVSLKTTMGEIVLELNKTKAPITVENFLSYLDKGHYDGTIFHRVISDFMIQGGGFTKDMEQKKTDKPIKNEWQNGLKNVRGTVAMARLGDRKPNPATVDSATAQFFINVKDNDFLDRAQADGGAYCVFGKVVSGMDVVDKIKVVKTETKAPHGNVPTTPVVIEKASRLSDEAAAKYRKP